MFVYLLDITARLLVDALGFLFTLIYIFWFIPVQLCVYKVVVVKLLDYLLDITVRLELEAQAFHYTRINIC